MSSEALEPPFDREQILGRVRVVERGETTLYERALLAEVVRLEQEAVTLRREWRANVEDLTRQYGAALAVAREREQRAHAGYLREIDAIAERYERQAEHLREALEEIEGHSRFDKGHPTFDRITSLARAALEDEPAAGPSEDEAYRMLVESETYEAFEAKVTGSASAAADEPGETP